MTTQNIRFLAKQQIYTIRELTSSILDLTSNGAVCRSNLANTLITDARTAFALLEYQNEERN